MILWNPTDETLRWPAGVLDPFVNGPEEAYFPPKLFSFAPDATIDVADNVAAVLLEHLGPRGLVSYRYGGEADRAELRATGRRQWYEWLGAQVLRHQTLNEDQRNNGRTPVRPNPAVRRCAELYQELGKGEFADTVLDIPRPSGGAIDTLQVAGDADLVRAAARARDREAMPTAE